MFRKFYELFNALNDQALRFSDQDISLIEEAQKELMDSWTDYMMSRRLAPTRKEMNQYYECLRIIEKF